MKNWLFKIIFKQQVEEINSQIEYLAELLSEQIERNSKLENKLKDLKQYEKDAKEDIELLKGIIDIDEDKIKELKRELELDNIIIGGLKIYGKK